MAINPLPLADIGDFPFSFQEWLRQIQLLVGGTTGLIPWANVSKTGSNLTDLVTRVHNDLQSIQGGAAGEEYHLTLAQNTDLVALSANATMGLLTRTGVATWASRTLTGTSNRLDITNGSGVAGNPTLDISATYVGQASITTLGTIATGTWSATTIATTKGGTGLTSYIQGDLLYASASNTLLQLAKDANSTRYLSNTGSSNNPAWAQVNLANGVTGTLPIANGGNGLTSLGTANQLLGVNAGATALEYKAVTATLAGSLTIPSLTIGRIPYVSTGGLLADASIFTWDNANKKLTVNTIDISLGASNISTNVAIGASNLSSNTTGSSSVAIGFNALLSNTTGASNVGIGLNSLFHNTTGSNNVAIGNGTLIVNTTGAGNFACGHQSMNANVSGSSNVAIGAVTLQSSTGDNNTAIGGSALNANTTGNGNTGVGLNSLVSNTTGSQNSALSMYSLFGNTTGSNNIGIGFLSGRFLTTGNKNILIGYSDSTASLNQVTTGSSNISIGIDVAVASSTANNQLCIGNLIYGTALDGTGSTVSTGQISIGYSSSLTIGNANRLQVTGSTAASNSLGISAWSADALGSRIELGKSRGAGVGTNTIVQSGDVLGTVTAYGANGSSFTNAAQISFESDGTPGASNDMPGRILFKTTPDGSGTLATVLTLDQAKLATFAGAVTAVGVLTLTPSMSMLSTGAAPTIGSCTLGVGGTVTVNTTSATATCKIFFQRVSTGGTVGFATTYTVNAGTSFTVSSDNALDLSVYNWWIVEAR